MHVTTWFHSVFIILYKCVFCGLRALLYSHSRVIIEPDNPFQNNQKYNISSSGVIPIYGEGVSRQLFMLTKRIFPHLRLGSQSLINVCLMLGQWFCNRKIAWNCWLVIIVVSAEITDSRLKLTEWKKLFQKTDCCLALFNRMNYLFILRIIQRISLHENHSGKLNVYHLCATFHSCAKIRCPYPTVLMSQKCG